MNEAETPRDSDTNDDLPPTLPVPERRNGDLHGLDPKDLIAGGLEAQTVKPAWQPPAPEELSRLLPQYEIDAFLGRGGMGAVYRGRQVTLDRRVAIKLLPAELTSDAEFVARFEREARTLAKLHHPGIVLVHDFGQTSEGHLYFVMEFVDGTDLHRVIHGPGLDCGQALEIITQICDALQYAHSQGVVHRDIKPANVILSLDGRAKLADFGLARPMGDGSGAFTRTNVVMGTPDYMAPEALAGESDHRADLYSLGVMLYEMLTGKPPRGAWAAPSQRVQVDVRLDEVVIRALQEDRELRYQQASEIKTDVEAIRSTPVPKAGKGKLKTGAEAPGRRTTTVPKAKKAGRRMAWAAALALLLVVGAGVWFAATGLTERDTPGGESMAGPTESGEVRDTKSEVEPEPQVLAARERGGRLRVFGSRANTSIELGDASAFDDFVEVTIGNEGWVARRANGEAYGQMGLHLSEPKKLGPLYTTHLLRGSGGGPWMQMADGSFGVLYNGNFERVFDPDVTDPAGILNAYGGTLVLSSGGHIRSWGKGWEVPNRDRPPVDFFLGASAWASADTSFIAADRRTGVRSFRADGTLTEFPPTFRDVVEMDAGRDHVVMRSGSGGVFLSDGLGKSYEFGAMPLDLGPAVSIRAGTRMSAAQMADGTWRVWGESTDLINQVQKIGHAIDLDLHSDANKSAYMMWIEPVGDQKPSTLPAPESSPSLTKLDWKPAVMSETETAQAAADDGWVTPHRWYAGALNKPEFADCVVRLRFRWTKGAQLLMTLRDTDDYGSQATVHSEGVLVLANWEKSAAPEKSDPNPRLEHGALETGEEGTLEFAVVGQRAFARLNGKLLSRSDLSDLRPGMLVIGNGYMETPASVREVEYASLAGIEDPLKALGWEVAADSADKTAVNLSPWKKAVWSEKQRPFVASGGWFVFGGELRQFEPRSADEQVVFRDGAVRAKVRFTTTKSAAMSFWLRQPMEHSISFLISESELVARRNSGNSDSVERGRIVFDTPLRPGEIVQFEAAAVDDTFVVRFKGKELRFEDSQAVTRTGRVTFHGRMYEVKDVEYAILDGVEEPWKVLGWELGTTTPRHEKPWRDFLAELADGPHKNTQLGRVWTREDGGWRAAQSWTFALPDDDGRDLSVRITGTIASGKGPAGTPHNLDVHLRQNPEGKSYTGILFNTGRANIRIGGRDLKGFSLGPDFDPAASHTLELRAEGDRLTLLVDDVELGSVRDASLAPGGLFGVTAAEGSLVEKVEYRFLDTPIPATASPSHSGNPLVDEIVSWVFKKQGHVVISQEDRRVNAKSPEEILPGPFDLTGVHLPGELITDAEFARLGSVPTLRRIELKDVSHITSLKPIAGLTELNNLWLPGNQGLAEEELVHLAGMTNLGSLRIKLPGATGEGFRHLQRLPKLKLLSLDGAEFTEEGAEAIAGLPELDWLLLIGCVREENQKSLVPIGRMPKLTSLDINGTLTTEGFAALAPLKLTQLNLSSSKFDNAGFPLLTGSRNTLTELVMAFGATVSDEGIRHIVANFPNIERTSASYGSTCTGASIRELAKLPKLKSLSWWVKGMQTSDYVLLADLPVIERIGLSFGTDITDEALPAFAKCQHLKELALSETAITDVGLRALQDIRPLKTVDLQKTKITPAGLAEFQKARPDVEVVHDFGTTPTNLSTAGPETASSTASPTQREIAERLLCLKAELRIRQPGKQTSLKFGDKLPEGDLDIIGIAFPMTANATDETFALVSSAPELVTLIVNGPVTTLTPVAGLTQLTDLSIYAGSDEEKGDSLPEDEMRHLEDLGELESLTLSHMVFTGQGCRHLAGATKLKSLFLGQKGKHLRPIDEAGAESIAQLTTLTSLTLRGQAFDPANAAAFRIIAALPNLTRLDLGETTITREMLAEIAKMPALESLELGTCQLESQEFSLLAPLAERLSALSFGYDSNLSDAGVKEIADTLVNLKQFNLGWKNACTGAALRELARLPKLRDFRYQKRDGLILPEDFEALTRFPALNLLSLVSCDLTDDYLKPLGRCSNLVTVTLTGNDRITETGIATLKAALPACEVKK